MAFSGGGVITFTPSYCAYSGTLQGMRSIPKLVGSLALLSTLAAGPSCAGLYVGERETTDAGDSGAPPPNDASVVDVTLVDASGDAATRNFCADVLTDPSNVFCADFEAPLDAGTGMILVGDAIGVVTEDRGQVLRVVRSSSPPSTYARLNLISPDAAFSMRAMVRVDARCEFAMLTAFLSTYGTELTGGPVGGASWCTGKLSGFPCGDSVAPTGWHEAQVAITRPDAMQRRDVTLLVDGRTIPKQGSFEADSTRTTLSVILGAFYYDPAKCGSVSAFFDDVVISRLP